MKRVLCLLFVLPLLSANCYSYTTFEFEAPKKTEEPSPGRLILSEYLKASDSTLSMVKEHFTGADPSLEISIERDVGGLQTDGIEALGLLTLCALPCGRHNDITLTVSYKHNGILLETETYRARYQAWAGLIIGSLALDEMIKRPDLNNLIQEAIPAITLRSKILLNSDRVQERVKALEWLQSGILGDSIVNISVGTYRLDAAYFSCLENPAIHECDAFTGNEFEAARAKTWNTETRNKKYALIANWEIDKATYDFDLQAFTIEEIVSNHRSFSITEDRKKTESSPRTRYSLTYSDRKTRPTFAVTPEKAESFLKKSLRFAAIAEIESIAINRPLYECMGSTGRRYETIWGGEFCRKKGDVPTRHVILKIKRWVLMETNGGSIQKGSL